MILSSAFHWWLWSTEVLRGSEFLVFSVFLPVSMISQKVVDGLSWNSSKWYLSVKEVIDSIFEMVANWKLFTLLSDFCLNEYSRNRCRHSTFSTTKFNNKVEHNGTDTCSFVSVKQCRLLSNKAWLEIEYRATWEWNYGGLFFQLSCVFCRKLYCSFYIKRGN